jgi:hypothetical protein
MGRSCPSVCTCHVFICQTVHSVFVVLHWDLSNEFNFGPYVTNGVSTVHKTQIELRHFSAAFTL